MLLLVSDVMLLLMLLVLRMAAYVGVPAVVVVCGDGMHARMVVVGRQVGVVMWVVAGQAVVGETVGAEGVAVVGCGGDLLCHNALNWMELAPNTDQIRN